jgi:hypothetical protein
MAAAGAACDKTELDDTYHGERYSAIRKIIAYNRGILDERGLLFSEEINKHYEEFRDFPSSSEARLPGEHSDSQAHE